MHDRSIYLGPAVAMSAALTTKDTLFSPAEQFDALQLNYEVIFQAEQRLLNGRGPLLIQGVSSLERILDDIGTRNVIIAGSQYGASSLAIAALSSIGARIAGLYWKMPPRYFEIIQPLGVPLIDMTKENGTLPTLKKLQALHATGYNLFLLCDAPGRTRRRYRFLGYDVTCSNLIEVYARYNNCVVLPFHTEAMSSCELRVNCTSPQTVYEGLTQRLLTELERLIRLQHTKYLWSGGSIIFSDRRALPNGLRLLPEFLDWRDSGEGVPAEGQVRSDN